ncbi:RloB family protein [Serratia marcescens]|uniref:RloB family protein n=1 Tax=Serratia marcescens TaxID=615 RepID=UPI00275F8CD4|nr:RloB family protein [Serratia marcescens]MDP8635120.1 RloB family protein [Serratia marcescens]MDP8868620.1 RloB family protein [Serratia marcescens]
MSKAKAELFKPPALKARGSRTIKSARKKTLIVCEGTVTEPSYFKDMVKDLKISNMDVVIEPGKHSNPTAVVQTAIDLYENDKTFELIYCLIDTDEFGRQIADADRKLREHTFSRRKKTEVGDKFPTAKILRSNPCIEVWFLLHFVNLRRTFVKNKKSAAINCKEHLKKMYIQDYNERYEGLYMKIKNLGSNAVKNSESLKAWVAEEKILNPWTQIDELYLKLQDLSFKK